MAKKSNIGDGSLLRESDDDPIRFDEGFDGPIGKRVCTDVLFLLLLVIVWTSMLAIGLAAVGLYDTPYVKRGDPYRLLKGTDYQGHLCGKGEPVTNFPNLWLPNRLGIIASSTGVYVPSDFGICVQSCPSSGESRSDPYGVYGSWESTFNTYNILGYCKSLNLKKVDTLAGNMLGDFLRAMNVVCISGFLLAAAASLLFLATMRIPYILRIVVWTCIGLVFLLFAVGGYVFITNAKEEELKSNSASGTSTVFRSKVEVGVYLIIQYMMYYLSFLPSCLSISPIYLSVCLSLSLPLSISSTALYNLNPRINCAICERLMSMFEPRFARIMSLYDRLLIPYFQCASSNIGIYGIFTRLRC
jgi:hypothetical protein